jgi:USP8 interacting
MNFMKNYWMIMFTWLLCLSAAAQPVFDQRMEITDAGDLYSTYDLKASVANGELRRMFGEAYPEVIKRSSETGWPAGLMTLGSRGSYQDEIRRFVAYKVIEFGDYVMLQIPAAENQDQPASIRAAYDFYMIFNTNGVAVYKEPMKNTGPNSGIPAKLLGTGGLRSTYKLATDEFNPMIRRQLGKEYPLVIVNSMEDSWPAGIATMEARDKVRDAMLNYKCRVIAEFDKKYILRIPAAENEFMPANMRPQQDIYFTIDIEDVKLLK